MAELNDEVRFGKVAVDMGFNYHGSDAECHRGSG